MSSVHNDLDTLNGLFKTVYADKLERVIPEGMPMLSEIPFLPKDQNPGENFVQGVVLGLEHGITFAPSGAGAFNLDAPISGRILKATVNGSQALLRSAIAYSAAFRSEGNGAKAFEDATKFLVGNMQDSFKRKLEVELLYGQVGYGTVATGGVTGNVVTITTSQWASGIWAGAEGMPIEFRDPTTGALHATTSVVSVSLENRTITVDNATGALDADIIWHKTAYGAEFAGIHKIMSNTGELFGINASTYNLWKSASYAPGSESVLSFAIIQQAIAKGVEKGLKGTVMALVNPGHWDDLLTEQSALRMYDSSYKTAKTENGSEAITFHAQNGTVEIVPSTYVKEGYAYILAKADFVRVGSTDVTFKRPGQKDNFFRELENAAGYELRMYTDQALFCAKPGRQVLISNIKTA